MSLYDNLITPLNDSDTSGGDLNFFIYYLNRLEGFKTKCKNLHWAAPKKNIHVYIDDFLTIMQDFQDAVAEGYMGILGKMQPNAIKPIANDSLNAINFIEDVRVATLQFYDKIPEEPIYAGIKSECETFIQNVNSYTYLFSLCDVKPY